MKSYNAVTLGKSLTKFKKNGLILTETRHQPNLSLSKHSHKNDSIACVLEGSYDEKIDYQTFECIPNSLLVKPGGEYHSNKYNRAGAHCLLIEIKPKRLKDYSPLHGFFSETRYFQKGKFLTLINRIRQEMTISDNTSEIAIEGLILELFAIINRQSKQINETGNPYWLKEAKDFIHAHSSEPISLSVVAKAIGYHPSHIARVFRQKNNCSIGTYIRQTRLENAAKQLLETNKSLAEISASTGFYDQSHFTSAFKLYTGMTPTKYRAKKN